MCVCACCLHIHTDTLYCLWLRDVVYCHCRSRRYPSDCLGVLPCLVEIEEFVCEPEAKAAYVWIIGQFFPLSCCVAFETPSSILGQCIVCGPCPLNRCGVTHGTTSYSDWCAWTQVTFLNKFKTLLRLLDLSFRHFWRKLPKFNCKFLLLQSNCSSKIPSSNRLQFQQY